MRCDATARRRILMDNVDEWWGIFFLVYKCSIGFAVVQAAGRPSPPPLVRGGRILYCSDGP